LIGRSGKVLSITGSEQFIHSDWIEKVIEFSTAAQLDAIQAYNILENYLNIHQKRMKGDVQLEQLIEFYYAERSSLLECIAALFRICKYKHLN
jgi:hypothetical protein